MLNLLGLGSVWHNQVQISKPAFKQGAIAGFSIKLVAPGGL